AAVVDLERRIDGYGDAEGAGKEAAEGVTGGRLDLDDVGAPIAEDGGGGRAGDPDAHLDNFDALHGSRHVDHLRSGLWGDYGAGGWGRDRWRWARGHEGLGSGRQRAGAIAEEFARQCFFR